MSGQTSVLCPWGHFLLPEGWTRGSLPHLVYRAPPIRASCRDEEDSGTLAWPQDSPWIWLVVCALKKKKQKNRSPAMTWRENLIWKHPESQNPQQAINNCVVFLKKNCSHHVLIVMQLNSMLWEPVYSPSPEHLLFIDYFHIYIHNALQLEG